MRITTGYWSWAATHLVLVATVLAPPVAAQPGPLPDSSFTQWARARVIPLPSADEPYADSSFDFLRSLVGSARILALGEQHHCGHEPLAFRNHVIRYAVTHLGVSALALESGLTEAEIVERFIQGGPGNVDSILRAGFTWQFGTLDDNRQMVLWLRDYNRRAARRVHFYGVDLTGADDTSADVYVYPGASKAVLSALDYLRQVAPAAGATLSSRLVPLMRRFRLDRYQEYSSTERQQLQAGLDSMYRRLSTDSIRDIRASSARGYAQAVRDAWMALRLNDIVAGNLGSVVSARNGNLRDSVMAENTRWVVNQERDAGRVILFAHNGHVMNAALVLPAFGETPITMLGQRLRRGFGLDMVVIASTTAKTVGFGESPVDPRSLDAALAQVGRPNFVLDLRRVDSAPAVRALLEKPWPFRFAAGFLPKVPRKAADAMVYFDQVTGEPTPYARVACNG